MDYIGIIKRYWYVLRNNRTIWSIGAIQGLVFFIQTFIVIGLYFLFIISISMGDTEFMEFVSFTGASLFSGGIAIIVLLFCAVMLVFHLEIFVIDIALMNSVDRFDQADEKITLGQAIKLGWSKRIIRLLGLQVIWYLMFFIEMAVVFGVSFGIYKILENSPVEQGLLILLVMGVGLLIFGILSLLTMFLTPLVEMTRRVCILEDKGIFESLRSGFSIFFTQPIHLILMVIIIYIFLFIQNAAIYLFNMVFSLIAYMIAAMVFVVLGGLSAMLNADELIAIAFIISMVVAILISMIPMGIMSALLYVSYTSMWTLTYRQVVSGEGEQQQEIELLSN